MNNNVNEFDNMENAVVVVESPEVVGTPKDTKNDIIGNLKKLPKKLWLGVIAIVLVIIVACGVASKGPTIDLDDYVIVTTSGYDGYGMANVSVDWNAIDAKYSDKLSYSKQMEKSYGAWLSLFTPAENLRGYVSVTLVENTDLSNGDEVAYAWVVDEERIESELNCKVKYKDGTVKIEDLEALEPYDPFTEITVEFSGASSNGTAELNHTGELFSAYDYVMDKSSDLENGDVVTVSLDFEDVGYFAKNYGKEITTYNKEYVVSGLGEYVTELAQLNAESTDAAKEQAERVIAEYVDTWMESVTIEGIEFVGDFLRVAKDDYINEKNEYGVIYKINASLQPSKDYDAVTVENYYYVAYEDLVVDAEGKCQLETDNYRSPGETFTKEARHGEYSFSISRYNFYGCETLSEVQEVFTDGVTTLEWNVAL